MLVSCVVLVSAEVVFWLEKTTGYISAKVQLSQCSRLSKPFGQSVMQNIIANRVLD